MNFGRCGSECGVRCGLYGVLAMINKWITCWSYRLVSLLNRNPHSGVIPGRGIFLLSDDAFYRIQQNFTVVCQKVHVF